MLIIRFQRVGRVHTPDFRIVLAEKHRSASKKSVEVLGSYNPQSKNLQVKDQDRLQYWLNQHVEVSPSVWNLLVSKSLAQGPKIKAWRPKVKDKTEEQSNKATEEQKTTETAQAKVEEKKEEPKTTEAKNSA